MNGASSARAAGAAHNSTASATRTARAPPTTRILSRRPGFLAGRSGANLPAEREGEGYVSPRLEPGFGFAGPVVDLCRAARAHAVRAARWREDESPMGCVDLARGGDRRRACRLWHAGRPDRA